MFVITLEDTRSEVVTNPQTNWFALVQTKSEHSDAPREYGETPQEALAKLGEAIGEWLKKNEEV